MSEYINRERARFEAKRYFKNMGEIQEDLDMLLCMLPAENVSPVQHGRWVEYPRAHYFKCSNCKYTVPYRKANLLNGNREYNYCPHCGAKIDGGEYDG